MTAPVCKMFFQGDLNEIFREISSLLSELGVFPDNPRTNEIYCYDPGGERHLISKEKFLESDFYENYSGIQFWRAFDDDIFVAWSNDEVSICQFCFYLDGLDIDFRVELIKALAKLIFCSKFIGAEGIFLSVSAE